MFYLFSIGTYMRNIFLTGKITREEILIKFSFIIWLSYFLYFLTYDNEITESEMVYPEKVKVIEENKEE